MRGGAPLERAVKRSCGREPRLPKELVDDKMWGPIEVLMTRTARARGGAAPANDRSKGRTLRCYFLQFPAEQIGVPASLRDEMVSGGCKAVGGCEGEV